MEGIFFVNSISAKILFDSGASHSFISQSFMRRLNLMSEFLDNPLSVARCLGDFILLNFGDYVVRLDDVQFKVDLIILRMFEFDVILGMD